MTMNGEKRIWKEVVIMYVIVLTRNSLGD